MSSRLRSELLTALFSILVTAWMGAIPLVAADRITSIDNAQLARLQGNVHPLVRTHTDLGRVDRSAVLERMKLMFTRTPQQQAALDTLLEQLQDPASPNYHKWLTPEQFGEQFGLSAADVSKSAAWLRSQGFTVTEIPSSRTYIAFSGTAAQVENTFHTEIHSYAAPDGTLHYANATDPALPAGLAMVVSHIGDLNDFRPKPKSHVGNRLTSSVSGNHFLTPGDFATIYNLNGLYQSGIDGSGQTIAVMGQTDLFTDSSGNFTDVVTFRTNSGLSNPPKLTAKLITSADPGIKKGDIDEANLDVEWAGAVARNANILYINSANGAFDALLYSMTNNVAPVLSISYGVCEAQAGDTSQLSSAAQQANAQGQTILAPSGDSGAADCDFSIDPNVPVTTATHGYAVDFPASLPNVTAMGGSEFTGDAASAVPCTASTQYWSCGSGTVSDTSATALSYIPEMTWNDTSFDIMHSGGLSASGGGISILFGVPSYQASLSLPNNDQGKPGRAVPDLALNASADHDGYLTCSYDPTAQTHTCICGFRNSCTTTNGSGTFDVSGGTSASVPTFAGIVAMIVQKTGALQGNVNANLYSLALSAPTAFHDITMGNNIVPCTVGTKDCPTNGQIGYSAQPGYDVVTGLGSVDASALVAAWSGNANAGDFSLTIATPALTMASGSSANDTLTVNAGNGFSGTVSLTCTVSSSLGATTCSVSPTSVVAPGTATVTIHAATLTARLDQPPIPFSGTWPTGAGFALAGVLLLPSGKIKRRAGRRNRYLGTLPGLLLLCLVMLMASCGGGSSSNPNPTPLSGTVTVTGASGSLSHSTQIAVTVN